MATKLRKLPKEELILFTRQLALVIDSDISVFEGLTLIKNKTDHLGLAQVLEAMLQGLNQGKSLATTISDHAEAFPPYLVSMADIGEKSGDLPGALNQAADALEKEVEATSKVKSAITYPLILSVLMLGVILLLILQVLPMFGEILDSLGGEMPALTAGIIAFSLFVGDYVLILLALILVLVIGGFFYFRSDKGKYTADKLLFKLPIVKDIASSLTAVRFARNMAGLLKSGISMPVGMALLGPVMNNRFVAEKLDQAGHMIKQGADMDKAIESLNLFPWVLVKLFSVAQQTGHMDTMLFKAADVMEKETDARLERLTTVIEPILIIILSIIIGIILISVILPIVSIMNSIG